MSTVNKAVAEMDQERSKPSKFKWLKSRYFLVSAITILALLLTGFSYFQATRFNAHVMINGTEVGGLTADQALKKLASAPLKNQVYVGHEIIFDGEDTKTGFTNTDLPGVQKLLKTQWTFFPSLQTKQYQLIPANPDPYRTQTMKKQVEKKFILMNHSLKAPQDAEAHLKQGQIIISDSKNGKQYDIARLLRDYQKQAYNREIHLNPVYIQPIKADSPIVKKEAKMLEALLQRTVDYKLQDKVYTLKASDFIKNASVSKEGKITIDAGDLKNKLADMNHSQSTLNKNFTFKTHSGAVISVKGQGYGWAFNVDKETLRIKKAFEKGEKSLSAANIYGLGWNNEGIGYGTTTNHGIGNTYAEVSIAAQRIWIYKNGRLVLSTNVVTGRHNTNEDTSPGVWYILFKQSPSTLVGSEAGNPHYSVKVNYWAPFTNDGQGFHDASWRGNWSSSAYLTAGSGGCVNTPPSVMKTVYDNLSQYEPVVIY